MTADVMNREIRQRATEYQGQPVIELAAVAEVAATAGCSLRAVHLAALELGIAPLRYARNIGTIGLDGQAKLLRSVAAVIGVGGLGGYVAEGLARMGVGRLILVDGDVFEEHNLNRQIMSSETRIGVAKTAVAKTRIHEINAAVTVTDYPTHLTQENLPEILQDAAIVVDGLDRLPARIMLQAGAQRLGIPMVHGSIAGFMGQVLTIFPGDTGLIGLFGCADGIPEQGLEVKLGTPAATPMAIAAWEVQEAVKVLTGIGNPLRNRLLVIDMLTGTMDELRMS